MPRKALDLKEEDEQSEFSSKEYSSESDDLTTISSDEEDANSEDRNSVDDKGEWLQVTPNDIEMVIGSPQASPVKSIAQSGEDISDSALINMMELFEADQQQL